MLDNKTLMDLCDSSKNGKVVLHIEGSSTLEKMESVITNLMLRKYVNQQKFEKISLGI